MTPIPEEQSWKRSWNMQKHGKEPMKAKAKLNKRMSEF